jgi:hypothetical protein
VKHNQLQLTRRYIDIYATQEEENPPQWSIPLTDVEKRPNRQMWMASNPSTLIQKKKKTIRLSKHMSRHFPNGNRVC